MKKALTLALVAMIGLMAAPASADLLAIEIDAQGGYTQLDTIEVPTPPYEELDTLAGPAFSLRGKLQILFLHAVVEYQHIMTNGTTGAEFLFGGLGLGYKIDMLEYIKPFFRGSVGGAMLYAPAGAFDPVAEEDFDAKLGFMARGGVGLEIPLGDWFALGVVADVGFHYFTQEFGMNWSGMGFLGLRI
jgi:hypothetical protein